MVKYNTEVLNMKLLIASDIHGDFESAKALINVFLKEKCYSYLE